MTECGCECKACSGTVEVVAIHGCRHEHVGKVNLCLACHLLMADAAGVGLLYCNQCADLSIGAHYCIIHVHELTRP